MSKPTFSESIIVEGKYDKNHLLQLVDANVVCTNGFSIFHDSTCRDYIRNLANSTGIIVFTDSDSAGFMIRNYIRSFVTSGRILHAYIPDVYGKEKRKRTPSAEGMLGVEGMESSIILSSLFQATSVIDDKPREVTMTDLYHFGLHGTPDASNRRKKLIDELALPKYMSAKELARFLNFTNEEIYLKFLDFVSSRD